MSLHRCITSVFYRLTELLLPENFSIIDVEVLPSLQADRYLYHYKTEIVIGITRYIVQFYARRNQLGEIIDAVPDSVEIAK